MAFEYFLYTTEFNNTLIDRGANSFAPLPPNTGEIYIDFLIPSIQPLYNYRESGGTIILNDEQTVNNFLNTAFPPTPFEPIDNQTFTGFTAQTETQYNNLVASLSGISTGETISAIAIHTDASANLTLTNQVSGITFLGNSNRNIVKVDLTNTRQIKLVSRVVTGSNSVNNPRLQLLFSPTFSTTVTNYTNIGISNIENSLVSATYADSGWIDLASTAKTEGFVTVSQIGGNAAADPALGYIYVFLKNIVQTTDSITQATFTGFTATTQNQINNKIDKVTGATDFIPQFISNGNVISSGYKISDLTGGTSSGDYLPLSGGTMTDSIIFDTDDGLGDRKNVGSIGLGVENIMAVSATTAISLDAPSIQFKNASDSGYTGSILTVGKDGFITYTTLTNEDVEFIDDIPNITTINDTNEHVIFEVTPNIDINKGFGEWYVRGNLPWWRNLTLRIRVNGVEKYSELYTNSYDFVLSKTVVLSEIVNSGDTVQVTVQSDVAGYNIFGDYLKLVKYGLVAGISWGNVGGNIDDQIDLIDRFDTKVDVIDFNNYIGSTGLQEITDINAITTNESTFNGGIITGKIKPTGDTTTAIEITKSDNTPIITIDSISGLTGFGTTTPLGLIHAYGVDNSEESFINTQSNAIIIDGNIDVDKDVSWFEQGVPHWLAETYRNEEAKFWYLYNVEADNSPLTIMETGRIGVNKQSNIINYHPALITENGLDSLRLSGEYTENYNTVYELEIVSSGSPDTYHWRISFDDGFTYGAWSPTSACTTGVTELIFGIIIYFTTEEGHTVGQKWRFAAFSQIPQATFTIAPMGLSEVIVAEDFTAPIVEYIDFTAIANGGLSTQTFSVFDVGTGGTIQSLNIGFSVKVNSVYITLATGGESMILVSEYWDGNTWINLDINYYIDGTNNFTTSGKIIWNPNSMPGWTKLLIESKEEEEYQLYWIRFRTESNPTKSPEIRSINIGNDKRLSVYSAFNDFRPSFYVNTIGAVNIGGGIITRKNLFQINAGNALDVAIGSGSVMELDSTDPDASDIRIKLVSDDNRGTGIAIVKTRGVLEATTTVLNGDELGHIWFRAKVGTTGATLNSITSQYVGDGTTTSILGDLMINTANGSLPIERVRFKHDGTTGFGITGSTAILHLKGGDNNIPSLRFENGSALLSSPQIGAVEFLGDAWYGTPTGGTRKTFAFLESPVFIGNPELPTGTTLNNENLLDLILLSGGSSGNYVTTTKFNAYTADTQTTITGIEDDITYLSGQTDLRLKITDFNVYSAATANDITYLSGQTDLRLKITDFNVYSAATANDINFISGVTDTKLDTIVFSAYTGTTIPWTQVSKVGSDLADLETRNASDVNISVPNWNSSEVNDFIQKSAKYIEETQGSGRMSPETVLFGRLTNILNVSGGTGYINYTGVHKEITWSGKSFNLSGYTEGTYYVYVDINSEIQIVTSSPNSFETIRLGLFYYGGAVIGVLQQCGCVIESSINRIVDFMLRQGQFIYDNGGKVQVGTGGTLTIVSPQMKVQFALLDTSLGEISSSDVSTYLFNNFYNSADVAWELNYHFGFTNGSIPVNTWNDITKNANVQLTGYTVTLTNGSNSGSSTSDLTSLISAGTYIFKTSDSKVYMTPITNVIWTGSETQITLANNYYGAGGAGLATVDYALPPLNDKFAKHLIVRTSDGQMTLLLGQTTYNTEDEAIVGVLPAIPEALVSNAIKMATIVVSSGTTDLSEKIFDIRPLPFQFREGGQAGGGTTITIHGELSGLGADDHLQYLKTDGTRNITGIQRYQSQPTFSADLDIITKKYSDDQDVLKLNITDFNSFTGTTLPANYYNKTEINFYTGTTAPNTFLNKNTGGVITGNVNITQSLFITGTTESQSVISGTTIAVLGSDGKLINSEVSVNTISNEVFDISSSQVITNLFGVYYINTTAGDITIQVPDATINNDGQKLVIIKGSGANNVIITTTGGTQNIGNSTSLTISQTDRGVTILSDSDNNKWLKIQDSRFLQGSSDGELQYWNSSLNAWQPTGTLIRWDNPNSAFLIGSGITPTLNVKANQDIVYINSTGLTGIVALDDLGFYAGGRGAFGNAVTIDRLRASSPSNQPRSLSLIDTNAVMRIWRYVNDTNDPAVEFIWGTEATPATAGNSWWDMFLDGGGAPNDMFSIRRRTENVNQIKLTIGDTVSNFPTTTTSTSPTTGALTVSGGVGIAGALNVGTTISGVTLFENNVSLVNKYLQISNFNTYSGATATAIGLKANIDAPTFTGIPAAPTAAVNTNTTQIATTAFVVGQAANVNPLVNGIVAIGTSLRFARQDHVHPTDTSRQATISGAATTITSNDLTANRVLISDVNGKVAVSTVTSAQLTALTANIYGSQFQLAESLGTSTTISATPQTKVTLTTPSLPLGVYKIFASWVGNANSATNDMIFDVTLNGTPLGTRTTINIELQDATTFLPLSRTFYRTLSGVNTILLRFSAENSVTTTISDAAIELIRVS